MFISFLSSTPLTFNSFAVHACTYSWADLASSSVKIGSSPTGFTRPESSFRVETRGTRSVQVWNGYVVSSIDLFFMALFTGVNIEVGWISDCKSSSFMLDGLNVDQEIKTVWKLYITPCTTYQQCMLLVRRWSKPCPRLYWDGERRCTVR